MAMAGLYRRLLPSPPAINFASSEGQAILLTQVGPECPCNLVHWDWSFFTHWWTGHFSPIGGYHAGRDMALILDVARFKYPPHWVPLTLLWEAMNNLDETTGQNKGCTAVTVWIPVLVRMAVLKPVLIRMAILKPQSSVMVEWKYGTWVLWEMVLSGVVAPRRVLARRLSRDFPTTGTQ
ncbi:hypothetical protein GH714_030374 [Hevea brasiliensis]|uniref:glutathione gamma-glutamylcysteinyltransferase n=1 Tax=Hevea brasiliensis TaxID=3981 RepID=A0A6A6KD38_HEVBR|nr:hypothetical protein GH714_030374 [Hevea brasiliensis]